MRRSATHMLRQRPRGGGHPDSDAWTYGEFELTSLAYNVGNRGRSLDPAGGRETVAAVGGRRRRIRRAPRPGLGARPAT
jgi:hypothetical protein